MPATAAARVQRQGSDKKVDSRAPYAARSIAKNIVAAGLAKRCEIELAYAIGSGQSGFCWSIRRAPASFRRRTGENRQESKFDLRPAGIIDMLNLASPVIVSDGRVLGHFGRTDVDLPWERVEQALRRGGRHLIPA